MRYPGKTLNNVQRERMTRNLLAMGSRQLVFDFVECETRRGPRWLEIEKEKAVVSEPPEIKTKGPNAKNRNTFKRSGDVSHR